MVFWFQRTASFLFQKVEVVTEAPTTEQKAHTQLKKKRGKRDERTTKNPNDRTTTTICSRGQSLGNGIRKLHETRKHPIFRVSTTTSTTTSTTGSSGTTTTIATTNVSRIKDTVVGGVGKGDRG